MNRHRPRGFLLAIALAVALVTPDASPGQSEHRYSLVRAPPQRILAKRTPNLGATIRGHTEMQKAK
jgi:hypothetical protein